MTLTAISFERTVSGDESARHALERRRVELRSALHLYEQVTISSVPRNALIARTRRALADVELALHRCDDISYGTCKRCHRRLAPSILTVRPLADRCWNCTPTDAA